MAINISFQSIFTIFSIIDKPTNINTGAIADIGTQATIGAKNNDRIKNNAANTAVNPVLPPASIPTLLSTYVVTLLVPRSEPTMSDLELINRIRESKQARKFDELYSGNTSGYPSPSNADFAFIRLLVFWTQDRNQLDSIFRSSGLMRDKWDKQIGDSTYGDITINNALSSYTRTYKIKQNEMY